MLLEQNNTEFVPYFEMRQRINELAKLEVERLNGIEKRKYWHDANGNIYKVKNDGTSRHIKKVELK